jgi:type I restriction enzyme M protein
MLDISPYCWEKMVLVSKLIAQLAMHKQEKVNKIYDPAAGSGSLLLQAKKHFDAHIIEEGFWGQEINHTTYNLARMNMFLVKNSPPDLPALAA